jgi:hypothetical protein
MLRGFTGRRSLQFPNQESSITGFVSAGNNAQRKQTALTRGSAKSGSMATTVSWENWAEYLGARLQDAEGEARVPIFLLFPHHPSIQDSSI